MSTLCEKNMTQKDILNLLCDEQWSNAACCGYVILACENLGYNKEKIRLLLNSMDNEFSRKTVDQAKTKYYNYL